MQTVLTIFGAFGTAFLVTGIVHRAFRAAARPAPAAPPASLNDALKALSAAAQTGPMDVVALSRANPDLMRPTAETIALSRKFQRIEARLRTRRAISRRVAAAVRAPIAAFRLTLTRWKYRQ